MGLLSDIARAVYREYDRRIKRASLVAEYGAHHHDEHRGEAFGEHADAGSEEEAEIVNLPRGTSVAASERDDAASEEADIANVPRGTAAVRHDPAPIDRLVDSTNHAGREEREEAEDV